MKTGGWGRLRESVTGEPQSKADTAIHRPQGDPQEGGRSPAEMSHED